MLYLRKSQERGHANHGWLDSYHSFSFADYYDPKFMGFSTLRVINEDFVAPGTGFGFHGHKDMEIITYMIEGTLQHKDTIGNVELLHAGEVQRMSAGRGIRHSEMNPLHEKRVHLLQIWIMPQENDLDPSYEQKSFAEELNSYQWVTLASPNSAHGSLKIHQDVTLKAQKTLPGTKQSLELAKNRKYWLQVVNGQMKFNELELSTGDAVAISEETHAQLHSFSASEVLLFDLPL